MRLSDLFDDGTLDDFDVVEAAPERSALPAGRYVAGVDSLEAREVPNGSRLIAVNFQILEGEYSGRRIVLECWITRAAMGHTKRDLGKLGIRNKRELDAEQFDRSATFEIRVSKLTAASGAEFNRVRSFERLGEVPQKKRSGRASESRTESAPKYRREVPRVEATPEPERAPEYRREDSKPERAPDSGGLFDSEFAPRRVRHERD